MMRSVHCCSFIETAWTKLLPLLALAASIATPGAEAAELVYPLDVAAADDGEVYVADRKLPGVLRIKEGAAEVVVEGSRKYRELLNAPWSVAVESDSQVLVGDSATRAVYRVRAGQPPEKLNSSYVGIPIRIAVDGEGRIYVSDLETERIWRFPKTGGEAEEFAVVAGVRGLTVDSQNRLWTVRANPPQIVRYSPDGKAETVLDEGPFEFPHQIAVSESGQIYVSDGYARCIWRMTANGTPEQWVRDESMPSPNGMALREDHLLVADPKAQAVFRVSLEGEVSRLFPAAAQTR